MTYLPNLLLSLIMNIFIQTPGAQETDIDPRIRNHYSNEQIADILAHDPKKIDKLNFYFRHSYRLLLISPCQGCPQIDLNTFDVTLYEKRRQKDRRVSILLTKPGYPVELLSQKELIEKYKEIEQ